jgi:hypothetical protein
VPVESTLQAIHAITKATHTPESQLDWRMQKR